MAKEKNIILEEGMKRFQQILEYTTLNNTLVDEADDTPEDNGTYNGIGGGQAPMEPDQMGNGGGTLPMDNGGGQAPMGADNGMGSSDPSMMGGEQAAQTPQGFNPQDNGGDMAMNGEMDGDMENTMQPNDEVVDITELTDKQEETDKNVLKIDAKFDKVMKALGKVEEIMRDQNNKIEDIKKEYEKRNPTQLEKLSMRAATSYPFNVSPEDYWRDKEATSNYRTEDDNNGVGQEQYTITKKDLDGMGDWKSISDSFNDADDIMYNQTLNKILGR